MSEVEFLIYFLGGFVFGWLVFTLGWVLWALRKG